MITELIEVMILQYKHITNHYVVQFKLTQCGLYLNEIGGKECTRKMNFKYQHRASDKHKIDTYRKLNGGY